MNNIETNEMNEVAEILNMDLSEGEAAVQTAETTGTETEGTTPSAAEKKKAINLTDLRYVKAYIEKCVNDGITAAVKKFTDGTETAMKATNAVNAKNATNAVNAENATKDKDGNEFSETYYKKTDTVENAKNTDFTNAEWSEVVQSVPRSKLTNGGVYEILVCSYVTNSDNVVRGYSDHAFIVYIEDIFTQTNPKRISVALSSSLVERELDQQLSYYKKYVYIDSYSMQVYQTEERIQVTSDGGLNMYTNSTTTSDTNLSFKYRRIR